MSIRNIPVGGNFSRIFHPDDYLTMISIPDEATCILRGHLIIEEILNLWCSKITSTEDLYANAFVPFKTKLNISRNLGMNSEIFEVVEKINSIRNRFSHRKGYVLEDSIIDSIKTKVDQLEPAADIQNCESFEAYVSGRDQNGERQDITYRWAESDNRIKFVLIFVILMLKLTRWLQLEFTAREIDYTITLNTEN